MSTRRETLMVLALASLWVALPSRAQQPGKVWRIGFLGPSSAARTERRAEALRSGLREYGYQEGKNLAIEFRWAEERYERLPGLAAELVRLNPDVIVTHGAAAVRAAKDATATVPIVACAVGDVTGLVASLARPGGNLTGTTFFSLDLYAKRIELLKEIFPRAKRFAFILNPDNPASVSTFGATERAVKPLKIELRRFAVRADAEFEDAFSAMARTRADAVTVQEDPLFIPHFKTIAELAAKRRLAVASGPEFAQAGGLIGYGPNLLELFHRAGYFVDRIFKGAKTGELPVERPTRFELVINAKAAKQIGVTIPPKVLARADRVIE